MATHLVKILSKLGCLRVPGPACTPWTAAGPGRAGGFAESLGLLVLIPLNIHTPKIATLPLQGDNGKETYTGLT